MLFFTCVRRSVTAAASSAVIDVPSALTCQPVLEPEKTMDNPTATGDSNSGQAIRGPVASGVGLKAFRLPWNVEISHRPPMRSMRACRAAGARGRGAAGGGAGAAGGGGARGPG